MGCAKLSVTRVIQIALAHHVLMFRLILPSDCLHILHIVHSPLGMLQGGGRVAVEVEGRGPIFGETSRWHCYVSRCSSRSGECGL